MGKLLMYRVDCPFDYVVKIVFCVSRVTLFSLDHRFESITLWLAVRGLIIQENGERESENQHLYSAHLQHVKQGKEGGYTYGMGDTEKEEKGGGNRGRLLLMVYIDPWMSNSPHTHTHTHTYIYRRYRITKSTKHQKTEGNQNVDPAEREASRNHYTHMQTMVRKRVTCLKRRPVLNGLKRERNVVHWRHFDAIHITVITRCCLLSDDVEQKCVCVQTTQVCAFPRLGSL